MAGAFVRPLAIDDDAIGGKARSLARLAALGLPIPRGLAVGAALFRWLRAHGPPLPPRLASVADLARLDAARAALEAAPFPEGFEDELGAALDALDRSESAQPHPAPPRGFAVRSSFANEDLAETLGAGLYLSIMRVPRREAANAVRRVLASCLTPAAWVYAIRGTAGNRSGVALVPEASVLIHPFIEGDAAGVAALDATLGGAGTHPSHDGLAGGGQVHVDVRFGALPAAARVHIDSAVRLAAARYGPVEIEWVMSRDVLTCLQLRAYHRGPNLGGRTSTDDVGSAAGRPGTNPGEPVAGPASQTPSQTPLEGGWTWDAAHNPLPLSPAQAGLVQLIDARCSVGFDQKVIGGYLFFRRADDPSAAPGALSARAAFDRLTADIEPRLAALGPEPPLAAALEVFVAAYQTLFGVVAPASVAARAALGAFMTGRLAHHEPILARHLTGVVSAASRRRDAADAVSSATSAPAQQAAIDEYLRLFGDESPRWDVAEPTLRETPEVLLRFAAARSPRASDLMMAAASPELDLTDNRGLPPAPSERARFDELLLAARESAAVAEDDDALYARLQASVRRALLAIGRRLNAVGRLRAVDDVFFLPLGLARAIEDPTIAASDDCEFAPEGDLNAIALAGRDAFRAAAAGPPPLGQINSPISGVVRGLGGAAGRVIGRVVHHPAAWPTGPQTVLIASTLLPTELPLLIPGAIVVETGSILGHVAAQARERGIPAVVSAAGARAAIPEGSLVIVDGDRGEIVCLHGG